MDRTTHAIVRLAVLATTVMGLVLVTAGQAAAAYLILPDPGGGGTYQGPTPVQPATDNSAAPLQWVLFVAAVLGALAIGAALTHLAQGRRRAEAMETQHGGLQPEPGGIVHDEHILQTDRS